MEQCKHICKNCKWAKTIKREDWMDYNENWLKCTISHDVGLVIDIDEACGYFSAKKKWKKEIVQLENPYSSAFYQSQRKCIAIFEEVDCPKPGLYEARLLEIKVLEDYQVQAITDADCHQWKVGDIVYMRQHKPGYSTLWKNQRWFDTKHINQKSGEDFIEIIDEIWP